MLIDETRTDPLDLTPVEAAEPQDRRRLRGVPAVNVQDLFGAVVVGVCGALLLFRTYAPFSGPIGFVMVAYVVFVAVYATLVGIRDDRVAVTNAVFSVLMATAAFITIGALAAVVLTT